MMKPHRSTLMACIATMMALSFVAMFASAAVDEPYAIMYDDATPADWKIRAGYDETLSAASSANFTCDVTPLNASAAPKTIIVTYWIDDETTNISAHVDITPNASAVVSAWVNFTALQMSGFEATDNGTLYITVSNSTVVVDSFLVTISISATDMSASILGMVPLIVSLMIIVMLVRVIGKVG